MRRPNEYTTGFITEYTYRIRFVSNHFKTRMSSNSARPVSDQPAPPEALRVGGRAAGNAIEFSFDGRTVRAFAGESVACALFAAGIRALRESPRTGSARGMFCLMGSCQECAVWVDGRRVPACQVPARSGIVVTSGRAEGAS